MRFSSRVCLVDIPESIDVRENVTLLSDPLLLFMPLRVHLSDNMPAFSLYRRPENIADGCLVLDMGGIVLRFDAGQG